MAVDDQGGAGRDPAEAVDAAPVRQGQVGVIADEIIDKGSGPPVPAGQDDQDRAVVQDRLGPVGPVTSHDLGEVVEDRAQLIPVPAAVVVNVSRSSNWQMFAASSIRTSNPTGFPVAD